MQHTQTHQRPPFEEALGEWRKVLAGCGHPVECEWILDENLVFEPDPSAPSGFRLAFQTRFSPRPDELPRITYEFFAEFDARIVFYRLGTSDGKSVCLVLCDSTFEERGPEEGFLRRDEWNISFHPGPAKSIEEVVDERRWKNRVLTGRPLTDVDFCIPLSVLRELEVHGRVLTPYERFGVKIAGAWERWQRSSEE